jgi:hypothetical protein
MKERILEELSKPIVWGASPDLTHKETMGIMAITAIGVVVFNALGLI